MLFTFMNVCIYSASHSSISRISIHRPQMHQNGIGEWNYITLSVDAEHTGATSQVIMYCVFCMKERVLIFVNFMISFQQKII
jgi:hypothetical protein